MTPQEPPLAREALEQALEDARETVKLNRSTYAPTMRRCNISRALLSEHAEVIRLAWLHHAADSAKSELEEMLAVATCQMTALRARVEKLERALTQAADYLHDISTTVRADFPNTARVVLECEERARQALGGGEL